jgi:hypothetical protein
MPRQKRSRCDQKRRPLDPRQQSGRSRKETTGRRTEMLGGQRSGAGHNAWDTSLLHILLYDPAQLREVHVPGLVNRGAVRRLRVGKSPDYVAVQIA